MRLLLDTHVLLWQFGDDPLFTSRFRDPIFDDANTVFVSDVSVWEVVMKSARVS